MAGVRPKVSFANPLISGLFDSSEVPLRLLDLFSGTGSVGDVYRAAGWEVVSLDCAAQWGADIQEDILTFDYTVFPPHFFHTIWAAPPCTEYSRSKTIGVKNIAFANSIIQRTLDLIDYLRPQRWVLENPRFGDLRHQAVVQGRSFVDVDYCQCSRFGYQKATRFWGSVNVTSLSPLLCDPRTCVNVPEGSRRNELRLEMEGVSKSAK